MPRTRAIAPLVLSVLAAVVPGALLSSASSTSPGPSDGPSVDTGLPSPAHGATAIRGMGDRIDEVAAVNHLSASELRELLKSDATAWIGAGGRIYYVEPAPDTSDPSASGPEAVAPFPLPQTFLLHSKAGSNRTIYLDFNGHTVSGTSWNAPSSEGGSNLPNGAHPAWDPAGDGAAFSNSERELVQDVWRRVAEDFAPFDVDVTTQDPGVAAIERTDAADQVYGTRALITPSTQARQFLCNSTCGGIAYLDVFDFWWTDPTFADYYQPAWVFAQGFSNNSKWLAEAVSHEVGHNLSLGHDGLTSPAAGYYDGANNDNWAPIMGVGYSQPISQWSKGDYTNANNTTQDDIALMAVAARIPFRSDEAGGTTATAAAALPTGSAYITNRTDKDVFSLGTCSGSLTLTANPVAVSPNLDIQMRLLNSSGAAVTTANPVSTRVDYDVATGMNASISTSVASGTYFVEIDGVGKGLPTASYDDYASIGAYTLTQTGCAASGVPSAPQNFTATPAGSSASLVLNWTAPASNGGSPITKYVISRAGQPDLVINPATTRTIRGLAYKTGYTFTIRARNANGDGPTATASGTTKGLPTAPTSVAATRNTGAGTITLSWLPPADTGGAPIQLYQVRIDFGEWVVKNSGTFRNHTFTGVAAGAHTVQVRCRNALGFSPAVNRTI